MKTIQVSDETFEALKLIAKEVATQDNRATAPPYFYQIQTDEEIAVPEGNGTACLVYDGTKIVTEEEIKNVLKEYRDGLTEEEFEEWFKSLDEDAAEDYLEDKGWHRFDFDTVQKYQNAFLTERACKRHIELNSYHYNNPTDYLSHGFRNPDLETVFEFLSELNNPLINGD